MLSALLLVCAAIPAAPQNDLFQQNSDQTQAEPEIPSELRQYLSLNGEQTTRTQRILNEYKQLVSAKQAEMRGAKNSAAIDPASDASRTIEKDLAAIEEARLRARHEISTVLTPLQLSRLFDLRTTTADDAERLRIAKQAASLKLIDFKDKGVNRPFGGAASVFAWETTGEVEQPSVKSKKEPLSKRKPPKSPPP